MIKKIFRWQQEPGQTYRGFLKVLAQRHVEVLRAVVGGLRQRMKQELEAPFKIAGFSVFAADGSRVQLPRTKSNQQAYCAQRKKKRTKKKAKRGKSPQSRPQKTQSTQRRKMKKQSAAAIAKKTSTPPMGLTLPRARRHGLAVVLAPRRRRFERTSSPPRDAGGHAGKVLIDSGCRLGGLRILEGDSRGRP